MTKNIGTVTIKSFQEPDHSKETNTLIEEAYNKIKQMIFQQRLIPGQRLVYRDLSKILNMSRTPIINALNQLDQEGFVVSESFRGFYVKPIDFQEAWDLLGVREALETYAVGQAIQRADARDIEILEEKLRKHEQYIPNYYNRKKFLLDAEFHIQIAAMTKNQLLKKLLKMNLEHVYLRFRLDNADPHRMLPAVKEHRKLVERMKKKDILGSIEMIRIHLRRARDHILNCLSKEEELSYP